MTRLVFLVLALPAFAAVPKRPPPKRAPPPSASPVLAPLREAAPLLREGYEHVRQRRYRAARSAFERCTQSFPREPACRRELAAVLITLEEYDAAAVQLREYLELAPDAPDAAPLQRLLEKAQGKP